jgi:hypothetical protein
MTLLPASFLATRLWRFWEYLQTWSSGKHELSYEWRRLGQRHFYYWQESWYLESRASKYVQKKVKSRQMGCNSDNKSAEVQWHGQHAILADTVESNTHRMSSGMAINLNASTLQNQAQCPSDLLLLAMTLPQPTPPSDWSGAYIRLPRRMPGYQACTSSSTHREKWLGTHAHAEQCPWGWMSRERIGDEDYQCCGLGCDTHTLWR